MNTCASAIGEPQKREEPSGRHDDTKGMVLSQLLDGPVQRTTSLDRVQIDALLIYLPFRRRICTRIDAELRHLRTFCLFQLSVAN